MSNWFEREEDELVRQVNAGEISQSEFHNAMRELTAELRAQAQDEADSAYDRVMGGY